MTKTKTAFLIRVCSYRNEFALAAENALLQELIPVEKGDKHEKNVQLLPLKVYLFISGFAS